MKNDFRDYSDWLSHSRDNTPFRRRKKHDEEDYDDVDYTGEKLQRSRSKKSALKSSLKDLHEQNESKKKNNKAAFYGNAKSAAEDVIAALKKERQTREHENKLKDQKNKRSGEKLASGVNNAYRYAVNKTKEHKRDVSDFNNGIVSANKNALKEAYQTSSKKDDRFSRMTEDIRNYGKKNRKKYKH